MMTRHTLLTLLALATSSTVLAAEDAPIQRQNPPGARWEATFAAAKGYEIRGLVVIQSNPDSVGVTVQANLDGLPSGVASFPYHIHVNPIPADGNCTAAGAHLDPENSGEIITCDTSKPETCQTGDLAGKHGRIPGGVVSWATDYTDDYVSTNPSDPGYVNARSIVIHLPDKTRIACANLLRIGDGSESGSNSNSGSNSGSIYGGSISANSGEKTSSAARTTSTATTTGTAARGQTSTARVTATATGTGSAGRTGTTLGVSGTSRAPAVFTGAASVQRVRAAGWAGAAVVAGAAALAL